MGSVILVVPSLLYCCLFFINSSISQPVDYSAEAKILLDLEGIKDPSTAEKTLAKKLAREKELWSSVNKNVRTMRKRIDMVTALTSQGCHHENNDSGYVASNIEETVLQGSPPESRSKSSKNNSEKEFNKVEKSNGAMTNETNIAETAPLNRCLSSTARNASEDEVDFTGSKKERKSSNTKFTNICKMTNKNSRKKRSEKATARKERKATKTLAIVLGVFLICWLPFFSCNITDAICSKMNYNCVPGVAAFTLTTWLGYMNSVVNPLIYTIFNPEFRKAFKKIMHMGT